MIYDNVALLMPSWIVIWTCIAGRDSSIDQIWRAFLHRLEFKCLISLNERVLPNIHGALIQNYT